MNTRVPADLVPTWIGAIAAAFGVAVAVVAIVLTYQQVRLTAIQLRDSARREAQNSEEQTRPYVGVDIVPGLSGAPTFDIQIVNFGKTTARDVRLTLVGDRLGPQSVDDQIGPALKRLFEAGFDLAPGARRRLFWRLPGSANSVPNGDMGAPAAAEIVVNYRWETGVDGTDHSYEERLRYDLSEYAKLAPLARQGATSSGSNSDSSTLKNAVHALHAIAEHVAELRR